MDQNNIVVGVGILDCAVVRWLAKVERNVFVLEKRVVVGETAGERLIPRRGLRFARMARTFSMWNFVAEARKVLWFCPE